MTRLSRREFAIGAGAVGLASALGPTVRAATPAGKPDVIVLGAGISGLETAWQLEQQGLPSSVLDPRGPDEGYRVVLGPYPTREAAESTGKRLGRPFFIYQPDR